MSGAMGIGMVDEVISRCWRGMGGCVGVRMRSRGGEVADSVLRRAEGKGQGVRV